MQGSRLTGHVRSLGGDRWELVANLPRQLGQERGRRVSRRVTAKGKRRADAKLREWLFELEQRNCADPSAVIVSEVLRRFLEFKREKVRPRTWQRYERICQQHLIPDIGRERWWDLSGDALCDYYGRKTASGRLDEAGGLSEQTALHLHAVLRNAGNWALKRKLIDCNPALDCEDLPTVVREKPVVWSDVQIAQAIEAARNTQLRIPIALASWCGLRRSEVCALRRIDVDLDGAALAVRKSVEQVAGELYFDEPKSAKSRRVIPMPEQLVAMLREHFAAQDEMRLAWRGRWNERGLVCCRRDGEPMKPESMGSQFRTFVRQHQLKPFIEFHGLRRSYLSGLHDHGAPDALIQDWAGHTDMRTTREHYIVTFSETEQAVLRVQESRIAAALAQVCQSRASAVASLDLARARHRRRQG